MNTDELIRKSKYAAEFFPLLAMIGLFYLMSPESASNLAGKIGRLIGPRLAASRKARANLKMALPGKTDKEYETIIAGMWDNLARLISEYQNLESFVPEIELVGIENLKDAFEDGQALLFSGHLANWEVMAPCLLNYGVKLDLVYRAPNNPWSDRMLDYYRSMRGKLVTIPKSRTGTRLLLERMQQGQSVGMLIDQKFNEGIAVPFFGHPAMTSPSFVQLAQKFKCPLLPFRVERIKGIQFRMTFYEPLRTTDDSGADLPVETVIAEAHALLESWITERPDQWLWVHRRWIDQVNPGKKAGDKLVQAKAGLPKFGKSKKV